MYKDSDPKRLARALMYRRINDLWEAGETRPEGRAVVLTGPEAGDVGSLRWYLGYQAKDTLFVDQDEGCLKVAAGRWPGVNTFHGSLAAGIKSVKTVGLAVMDFMGNFTQHVLDSVASLRSKLEVGSVITLTFKRGRESNFTPNWDKAQELFNQEMKRNPWIKMVVGAENSSPFLEATRVIGYSQLVKKILPKENLEVVFMVRYYSTCPMCIIALMKTVPSMKGNRWKSVFDGLSPEEREGEIQAKWSGRETFLEIGKELFSSGLDNEQVAEILNLPRLSINAWKAHWTRGTYK
jgi:hypothetical protein